MTKNRDNAIRPVFVTLLILLIFSVGSSFISPQTVTAQQEETVCSPPVNPDVSACLLGQNPAQNMRPYPYQNPGIIPPISPTASGNYTNEIFSSQQPNEAVNPQDLKPRPYIGTELYWISGREERQQENEWLRALNLDFIRVLVLASDVETDKNDDDTPFTDFSSFSAEDFTSGERGWTFGAEDTQTGNLMANYDDYVSFPLMMLKHYGRENFLGNPPDTDEYAEYVEATIYYHNVINDENIMYWEILNEPDYGWDNAWCSPECYADIFRRVSTRIKSHPNPKVNSVYLGGPVQGSGDPNDGSYPTGYPNMTTDDERGATQYIPTLVCEGVYANINGIGFLSWHDYGDEWNTDRNPIQLDQNYGLYNRTNAFYTNAITYANQSDCRTTPMIAISELNQDSGSTSKAGKANYKNFYPNLWHTSTLNNYLATEKVDMVSHFYYLGDNHWPKGLIYNDTDSGGLVRNPVWWAYREYIAHLQTRILAAQPATVNRWADVSVTTDDNGTMFYLIAVNKHNIPETIDFTFNVPDSLLGGTVYVTKETMQQTGEGDYGAPFAEPTMTTVYDSQPVQLEAGRQVTYQETIPPQTIVYYTVVRGD